MSEKTKYCHHCGAMIPYYDKYCPSCSEEQPTLPGMIPTKGNSRKKVWVAVLLSFLITGLGQLYLGKNRRALIFFGGTIIIGAILSTSFSQDQIIGVGLVIALISAYDAYKLAIRKSGSI